MSYDLVKEHLDRCKLYPEDGKRNCICAGFCGRDGIGRHMAHSPCVNEIAEALLVCKPVLIELAAARAKCERLEKTIANLIEMNLTRICSLCPHGSPMCCREQNDCRTAVVKWLSEIQEFPEVTK
jgi:hypothetical protein